MRKYYLKIAVFIIIFIFFSFYSAYSQEDFNAQQHFKIGKRFFENGEYNYAIKEFQKALTFNSIFPDARFLLGLSYLELAKKEGRFEGENIQRAVEQFEKVIFYDEKYEPAYIYLAEIYLLQKKYGLAEELLKRILKIEGFSYRVNYALGVVFYKEGKPEESIYYWIKTIEQNKNYVPACYNLAVAFYNKSDFEKSLDYIDSAVNIEKKDLYLYFKAKILFKLNRKDEAEGLFKDIKESYPKSEFAKFLEVRSLINEGGLEEALKLLDGVKNIEADLLRGYIYYKQGKFDEAGRLFQKLLEEDPLNLEAKEQLKKI